MLPAELFALRYARGWLSASQWKEPERSPETAGQKVRLTLVTIPHIIALSELTAAGEARIAFLESAVP